MSLFRAIFMGLREIWGHKVRSLLTLFCVLLGVASVVVTVGYMRGMTAGWRTWLNERGGLERIRVNQESVPEEMEHLASLSPGRTLLDARAIEEHAHFVDSVSPIIEMRGQTILRGSKSSRPYQFDGCEPQLLNVEKFEIGRGRFITDLDNHFKNQVMVVGTNVVEELFEPYEEPIGEIVMFHDMPFQIVGITKHYKMPHGENWLRWKNDVAFIPLRTAQHKIQNSLEIQDLDVKVSSIAHLDAAVGEIDNIMLHMHRGVRDFEVNTSENMSENVEKQERTMLTAGGSISLITMIVGGIGIMNLMLASINERVREIGIRKSIGARPSDIFFQFCVESVTLCILGGALGVGLGQGVIYWLQQAMTESEPPAFTMFGVVAGFTASVTIGVLAGIYPAFRAARLDPIEALRYE